MGNCLSRAEDAVNPTYQYEIVNGRPILRTMTSAEYDFQEYPHSSEDLAAAEVPELMQKKKEYLKRRLIELAQEKSVIEGEILEINRYLGK